MTKHLRMTVSCVYLRILTSFSEHLFYTLTSCTSSKISTNRYSKKATSLVIFKHFVQQLEVAICRRSFTLNSWKLSVEKLICNEVARCQPASLWKKLSHISSFMCCLYFLRMYHNYLFRRGFESSVTCNLPVQSRFI